MVARSNSAKPPHLDRHPPPRRSSCRRARSPSGRRRRRRRGLRGAGPSPGPSGRDGRPGRRSGDRSDLPGPRPTRQRRTLVGLAERDVVGGLQGQARRPARPAARRDGGVLAAGTMGLVVRRHGLRPVRPETSATGGRYRRLDRGAKSRPEAKFSNFLPLGRCRRTGSRADRRRCLSHSRGASGVRHSPSRGGLFGPHLPVVRPSPPRGYSSPRGSRDIRCATAGCRVASASTRPCGLMAEAAGSYFPGRAGGPPWKDG